MLRRGGIDAQRLHGCMNSRRAAFSVACSHPASMDAEPDEALAVMRSMAARWSDEHIAASLNRMGMQTGQGNTWTAHRVSSLRRVNGIRSVGLERWRVADNARRCRSPRRVQLSIFAEPGPRFCVEKGVRLNFDDVEGSILA